MELRLITRTRVHWSPTQSSTHRTHLALIYTAPVRWRALNRASTPSEAHAVERGGALVVVDHVNAFYHYAIVHAVPIL